MSIFCQQKKREIDEIVGRINGQFSNESWMPIRCLYHPFSSVALIADYRAADTALVTSLRGELNVVAKEDVASRIPRMVLSLVPIVGTPDEARPATLLVEPLSRLTHQPRIRTAILSGRPLSLLQSTLPVPGLILAGIYGVEIRVSRDVMPQRVEPDGIRPTIDQVKWGSAQLIECRPGFMPKDKGLAVAFHARFADVADADSVLSRARGAMRQR